MQIERSLLYADRKCIETICRERAADQTAVLELGAALESALENIGRSWEAGDVSLSQVYMAGQLAEDIIRKEFDRPTTPGEHPPRVAIAVLEDFHMLGKRLVQTTMAVAGQPVIDYGRVLVDELVEKVARDGVRVLLVSTLMLRSALRVRTLRAALDKAGLDVRIVVGGAPFRFDDKLWQEVGADAMGLSASDAVRITTEMMEGLS